MKIDSGLTKYLAELSRLSLDNQEELQEDLEKIIHYIDKLNELDTTGIEAASHSFDNVNRFREDIVSECALELLTNAPATKDGYIKVAKALD